MDRAEEAHRVAQNAIVAMKKAIVMLLEERDTGQGLRNVDIGRRLGIYAGHKGHEGHVSRTMLALLESDGVVTQDADTKRWSLR